MNEDCLKLTVFVGERERADRALVSDALFDLYERHSIEAAVLLRGIEGFGATRALHEHRLLTLSEDLPLVALALGRPAQMQQLRAEVEGLVTKGLVTVERALFWAGAPEDALPATLGATVKLTLYLGRKQRAAGRPAYAAAVDVLHRRGVSGATVFLGVDGVQRGYRRRARFFSRNDEVPLIVVAVGTRETIDPALRELRTLLAEPLATVERVELLKRGGRALTEPGALAERDDAGLGLWRELTVYADEQARHAGHPLYLQLVRRLRESGAAGATAIRGVWGYSADHPPHGDRLRSLVRRVPVAVVVLDRSAAMDGIWPIVDELTDEAGLVTSETVPAFRAIGPAIAVGGLRLASPPR